MNTVCRSPPNRKG